MKFIEIKEYSSGYYCPTSKDSAKDREKYFKRLSLGYGIIDLDSIVSVEPIFSNYDKETLEPTINSYVIYFKGNETRIYTDIDSYNVIKKYLFKEPTENIL